MDLSVLGLSNLTYSELILVVPGEENNVNVAPVGVKLFDGVLRINLYRRTQSYRLLKMARECTLNVVWDPKVFYNSVMNLDVKVELVENFKIPIVRGADASIEAVVTWIVEGDPAHFFLKPRQVWVKKVYPRAFNRATPAIIEALVHYTRIKPYLAMGLIGEARRLVSRIAYCVDTVMHATEDVVLRVLAIDILRRSMFLLGLT